MMATLLAIELPAADAAHAIADAWERGQAVMPLDPLAPAAEQRRIMHRLRPTHLLDSDGVRSLDGGDEVDSSVAAVVATSGTTGEAKGVELTWTGMEASARAVSAALETAPGDAWVCCVPVHRVAGLAILARGRVMSLPVRVLRFDTRAIAHVAEAGDATLVSLVPTALVRLLEAGAPLHEFRRILLGGGPAPPHVLGRAREAGATIVTTYGLTETWGGVVHDGHPLAGVELRIAGDGQVLVRGPMVMRGYRGSDAATNEALTPEGWLLTGDVGTLQPDGRLRIVGRLKDVIITGGANVSPEEVEHVLLQHPNVADACVVGAPDPEWGERVVAHIIPKDGRVSLEEIRAFARDRLAREKLPREVILRAELPRTADGKLLRRMVRDQRVSR